LEEIALEILRNEIDKYIYEFYEFNEINIANVLEQYYENHSNTCEFEDLNFLIQRKANPNFLSQDFNNNLLIVIIKNGDDALLNNLLLNYQMKTTDALEKKFELDNDYYQFKMFPEMVIDELDINIQNKYGLTPFLLAVFTSRLDIMKLLKKYGANLHLTIDSHSKLLTAFSFIGENYEKEIVDYLLSEKVQFTPTIVRNIDACWKGTKTELEYVSTIDLFLLNHEWERIEYLIENNLLLQKHIEPDFIETLIMNGEILYDTSLFFDNTILDFLQIFIDKYNAKVLEYTLKNYIVSNYFIDEMIQLPLLKVIDFFIKNGSSILECPQ
jgi:hypothetical protein